MDVVEGHDVPGDERLSDEVLHFAAGFQYPADAHVAWNDRIGHAGQTAVAQVNIGAAHFAGDRLEED